MKEYFIKLVQLFQEYGLIEPKYKTLTDRSIQWTQELTPINISRDFIIYEKLEVEVKDWSA